MEPGTGWNGTKAQPVHLQRARRGICATKLDGSGASCVDRRL